MTATPEKTDDYNICEDCNYNIAYEIRLEDAIREIFVCPVYYFGITDFHVEGRETSETGDCRTFFV